MSPLHAALVASLILLLAPLDGASGGSNFLRRSLLRDLGGGDGEHLDSAVDLNGSTFETVLGKSPARFAVVEFFASWCPACRNYKPQYEKVAKIFNGAGAVHPGIILMTRVDCAEKVNMKLCDKYSISHYPTLFWGPPSKFKNAKWSPEKEGSGIEEIAIEQGHTAELLLGWINKKLGSSFTLKDEKFDNEHSLALNVSDPEQIARAFYDVEEATAAAFNLILQHKMIKSNTRAPLIKFLQLMIAHHPSRRCRRGSADFLIDFDAVWPLNSLSNGSKEVDAISDKESGTSDFHICGKEVPREYWIFCRGSKKDTRGFSCGLWILLHSLTVRVHDDESTFAFTAICDFIHNFFICEECRHHFYEMCSSTGAPPNTTSELALWLWSAHNKVNERLMRKERELTTGDPKFPKIVWPPSQLCSFCKVDGQDTWNKDKVFDFLKEYYGSRLTSADKSPDKDIISTEDDDMAPTTSAMAVPAGAAVAIAIASCAFGALACFWRTQQKKRKQKMKSTEAHY